MGSGSQIVPENEMQNSIEQDKDSHGVGAIPTDETRDWTLDRQTDGENRKDNRDCFQLPFFQEFAKST